MKRAIVLACALLVAPVLARAEGGRAVSPSFEAHFELSEMHTAPYTADVRYEKGKGKLESRAYVRHSRYTHGREVPIDPMLVVFLGTDMLAREKVLEKWGPIPYSETNCTGRLVFKVASGGKSRQFTVCPQQGVTEPRTLKVRGWALYLDETLRRALSSK